MKPLVELLQKGFICRYQPKDILFYVLLGEAPELLQNGQLQFGSLYFYEEPCDWLRSNDKVLIKLDNLECLTSDDRMKLVATCSAFPVDPTDPIILSLLNKARFEAVLQTLHAIKEQTLVVQLSYDEAEKDLLLEQTINTEELMPHHSTVVLLCIEIYLGIGTKAALERAVLLGTDSGYGAAVDQLILEAKEKLKLM